MPPLVLAVMRAAAMTVEPKESVTVARRIQGEIEKQIAQNNRDVLAAFKNAQAGKAPDLFTQERPAAEFSSGEAIRAPIREPEPQILPSGIRTQEAPFQPSAARPPEGVSTSRTSSPSVMRIGPTGRFAIDPPPSISGIPDQVGEIVARGQQEVGGFLDEVETAAREVGGSTPRGEFNVKTTESALRKVETTGMASEEEGAGS